MRLPEGFLIRLNDDVVHAARGRLIIGGSPLTSLLVSEAAAGLLRDGELAVVDSATEHLAERLLTNDLAHPQAAGLTAPPPEHLTVVIPVRDRAAQLDRALSALQGAACIVVDDASVQPDHVAEVCRRHGAELVKLRKNRGPAGARNVGLKRVTTPIVAFVDCDVRATPTQLLDLARHLEDPSVALVGPRIAGISTKGHRRWFERYDATASSLTLGRRPASVRPGGAVAWLPSACLVGRTRALGSGFTEAMRVGEDVDLVWRTTDQGHRVRYDPSVVVEHETRSTMRGWLGRKFFYGTGGAALAARHGDRLAPAVISPIYAVAAAAILLRSRWSTVISAAALALGVQGLRAKLPKTPDRNRIAIRLAGRGLVWAVRQEAQLAVRHWWPLAAVGMVTRPEIRRMVATALAVDTAVALVEQSGEDRSLGVLTIIAGRRLDDLAYGAGLWFGAVRTGSARALTPRRPRSRPTSGPVSPTRA